MGLDLYRYRIEKPDLDVNKIYSTKELFDLDIEYRIIKRNEEFSALPQQMIGNLCQKVSVELRVYDDRKIFNFFRNKYPDIYKDVDPETAVFSFYTIGPDGYGFTDYERQESRYSHPTVLISHEDGDTITTTVTEEAYVYRRTKEVYQRKGLTDAGWKLLPKNSVYCFDADVVEELTHHGLSSAFLDNWEEGVTAFYPNW